jgi:hypothetical protein
VLHSTEHTREGGPLFGAGDVVRVHAAAGPTGLLSAGDHVEVDTTCFETGTPLARTWRVVDARGVPVTAFAPVA